jgi:phosphoserine phosphatase
MDDTMSRLARELANAIAAAVAADPQVEACRERARAAGYELQVSLEAVVGFATRQAPGTEAVIVASAPRQAPEITPKDRRFLKSLRIAPDDAVEVEREE